MRKYLQTVKDRLTGLKIGVGSNAADWAAAGLPETPATVQAEIDPLDAADNEIELLTEQLKEKQADARTLANTKNAAAEVIEKRAIAVHATSLGKLPQYGISVPAGSGSARTLPVKAVIKDVEDDDDGIGFKITMLTQGKNMVDFWEIERGEIVPSTNTGGTMPPMPGTGSGNSSATVLQPPYPFLKSTKKLVYVDDDVVAGVRYFYRVRGVNTRGGGEWSEPVSAVQ